jgi:predicted nuclease of restriction endonuclease-like (RecB) superfamily
MTQNIQTLNHDLVSAIRELLIKSRTQLQQTVNTAMVQTYWHVGRLIIDDEQSGQSRAEYGKQQLEQLAQQLKTEFGKGFDVTNLRNMRRFYLLYPIRDSVRLELSWTHYRVLMRVENVNARQWYTNEAILNTWSVRALERQISVLYYERLLASTEKQGTIKEAQQKTLSMQTDVKDYLRDPYVLDFMNLPYPRVVESDIEQGIIDNLQHFLLELGKGFAFVERQQRISTEDQAFYIDLVFYNFKLKCFLLIDLKLGKLMHQDVGQMDTYIRIYDKHRIDENDNPTIGLILCSEKSEAVAKYSVLSDNKQLFAAKYMPYLPTEEELMRELQRERACVMIEEDDNE